MNQEHLPPESRWPEWQRPLVLVLTLATVAWLGGIRTLIYFLDLWFPNLKQHQSLYLLIHAVLLLLPLTWLLPHALRWLQVARSRLRHYPHLVEELDQANAQVSRLTDTLDAERRFEIRKVVVQEPMAIILAKRKAPILMVGAKIIIENRQDRGWRGTFQIAEVGQIEYRAVASGPVDPLWLGSVVQTSTRQETLKHTVALFVPEE